jgi:hypothetical protein
MAQLYTGDAKLTQLNATVTDTSFELVYRCQKCWVWSQDGVEGSQLPTGSVQVVGWAQNSKRYDPEDIMQHDKSQGIFGISVDLARNAKYSDWIKLPAVAQHQHLQRYLLQLLHQQLVLVAQSRVALTITLSSVLALVEFLWPTSFLRLARRSC